MRRSALASSMPSGLESRSMSATSASGSTSAKAASAQRSLTLDDQHPSHRLRGRGVNGIAAAERRRAPRS